MYGKAYMSTSGIYWARGHRDFENWKASVFCFFATGFGSLGTELNNQSWSNESNPSYVIHEYCLHHNKLIITKLL
jgi:hypothetical protein